MTLPWTAAKATAPEQKQQAIGEYCGGESVQECTRYFGDGLAMACRTCPD